MAIGNSIWPHVSIKSTVICFSFSMAKLKNRKDYKLFILIWWPNCLLFGGLSKGSAQINCVTVFQT